jgi:N4-gp56 family major capsid protein
MLKRALPLLQIEKFGQTYTLPTNSTNTAKFRRYFLTGAAGSAGLDQASGAGSAAFYVPLATTPLVEGVTPQGTILAVQDYTVTLAQYGDFVTITDVIEDIHTDPVLQQATEALGEQAAQTIETLRFNVLAAGTNVWYAALAANRAAVATPLTLQDQRRVTTGLNRQNAKRITSVVSSTPDFNTTPVEAGYVAIVHPDLDSDIRNMTGFVPVSKYGTHTSPWEGEIGSVEQVRYLSSTIFQPFLSAGGPGGAGTTYRSTDGVHNDVYPILYFGRDAFGMVPLKGKSALTPMVVNPKPVSGDPLGQRGSVGWKAWQGTVILQDAFLSRLEVACSN